MATRLRRGSLIRLHRAVYAVGRPPTTPIENAAAAVLACGPGAALAHLGSLALWSFTPTWPPSFDVVVRSDRRPQGITTHNFAGLLRRDLRIQLEIRTTSPARTLLDCAPLLPPRQRTRTINDALHTPYLTQAQLSDVCARFPNHPGTPLLRPFLDGNPTRSGHEDDFVAFCERYGLPRPLTNIPVAGHEADAVFPAQRLIVELDSWRFHGDRHTFETDRERDADTLRAGWATVRVTWERLHERPDPEAARLRAILDARCPA